MKAAAKPMDSVQMAQGTGWKMKIIHSIHKAQELYDPGCNEDADAEKEESWKVKMKRGDMKRCKSRKRAIVKSTTDYTADKSFD